MKTKSEPKKDPLSDKAAYWEGWDAAKHTHKECIRNTVEEQQAWAAGYAAAVATDRHGKAWWRSETLHAAILLVAIGMVSYFSQQDLLTAVSDSPGVSITTVGLLIAAYRLVVGSPLRLKPD